MKCFFRIITALLLLLPLRGLAQVTIEAHLDTASILIGEQVQLRVKCSANAGQNVIFPIFKEQQELTQGVEVVNNGKVDTTRTNAGKRLELTRRYTITSFDSALYTLPPFTVTVDGKEYHSKGNVGLKVSTVAVDTVHVDKFSGPHDVVEQPFEWRWTLTLLALLAGLTALGALTLMVRNSDPRLITRRVVVHPPIPPHVTAIDHIQRIHQQPANDPKANYMALTETLRTYIGKRFGFNAKEMTTSEIIDELCATENVESLNELKDVLLKADLVKFAQYSASLPEQDRSLVQALEFVQTTKVEPEVAPKPHVEYVTLNGSNQRKLRWAMRTGAALLSLISLGLTAYVIGELYNCFM